MVHILCLIILPLKILKLDLNSLSCFCFACSTIISLNLLIKKGSVFDFERLYSTVQTDFSRFFLQLEAAPDVSLTNQF